MQRPTSIILPTAIRVSIPEAACEGVFKVITAAAAEAWSVTPGRRKVVRSEVLKLQLLLLTRPVLGPASVALLALALFLPPLASLA